jgi:hypothetical protein
LTERFVFHPAKKWLLAAALAPLAALVIAPSANAATPVEDAVTAWVAAVDAAPGWHASYASLAVDPATGAATISGLSVKSDQPGFALDVATLKVDGFHPSSDPVFAADELDVTDARVTIGDITASVPSATIAAPVLPETGGFTWDAAAPVLSAVHALNTLAGTAAASIKAPSVAISGTEIDASYTNVSLVGWRNGKIAATSAGQIKSASPAKDPLVTLSAGAALTRDIDLRALASVLDPAAYAAGAGDEAWRPAVGHLEYRDLQMDLFGIAFTAANLSADGLRLRQSKTVPTYAAASPGAGASANDEALRQLKMLPGLGADRLTIANVNATIPNVATGHLDTLAVAGLAGGHVGDFTLSGLSLKLGDGVGSVALAKFGIGGLVLPSPDAVQKVAAVRAAGGPVDYASLIPPITYVETSGLSVALPDVLTASLDRFRLDLGAYADGLPKTIGLDLAAADLPVAILPSEHARDLLARFGYDRLHLDAGGKVDATAAGLVTLEGMHFAMKDAGSVAGDATLTGSLPATPADAGAALNALALKDATVTVTDGSLVGRLIAAQAMRLKVDPEKFRQQFATGMPFMLMFLNDRDLLAKLTPALQGFIRNGGSLTAVAKPSAPVPLPAVVSAATTAPFTLFKLLATDVSGTPGAQATVIPTLPAVAPPPPAPASSATTDDNADDQSDDDGDNSQGGDSGSPDSSQGDVGTDSTAPATDAAPATGTSTGN